MPDIVHYENEAGLDVYIQFDDDYDTRIPYEEGTGDKLRRHVITIQDVIDSGLVMGDYNPTVRIGDWEEDTEDEGIIRASFEFGWDGEQQIEALTADEIAQQEDIAQALVTIALNLDAKVSVATQPIVTIDYQSGGGTLNARIGIVSLATADFLEVVQGEEKIITIIVEAHGRFIQESFDAIIVKFKDTEGTVITKIEDDYSIERVCETLDVQVLRCTLSEEDTASLVAGLLQIEIAFDSQKARLTHALKVLEQIIEEGS